MRLLDLTGVTLGQHLNMHRHKYITPNSTPDPDRTFYRGPLALQKITGKVVYQGDFWIKSGQKGNRRPGFLPLLSRIAIEIALSTWVPELQLCFCTYAFGDQRHAAALWVHTLRTRQLVWPGRTSHR